MMRLELYNNRMFCGAKAIKNKMVDKDGLDISGIRKEGRKEGREVDFVILKQGNIEELIEVKFSDERISKHLKYYINAAF